MKPKTKHEKTDRFEIIIDKIFKVNAYAAILSFILSFLLAQYAFFGLSIFLISVALISHFIWQVRDSIQYMKYIRKRRKSWHYFISQLIVIFFSMGGGLAALIWVIVAVRILYRGTIN